MSTEVSTRATTKFHPEHLLDRAAMLAMRAMIALQATADLGPGGAYVVGSAQAYRHFVGQIAARAKQDPLLTREMLESARDFYLGQTDAKDPLVSPLYGDPASLPPVLLHVGEHEILLDDARRYTDLLAKSGSAAELHIWQGMVHVFPANLAVLHAAREALDITGNFLRRSLARWTTRHTYPLTTV